MNVPRKAGATHANRIFAAAVAAGSKAVLAVLNQSDLGARSMAVGLQ